MVLSNTGHLVLGKVFETRNIHHFVLILIFSNWNLVFVSLRLCLHQSQWIQWQHKKATLTDVKVVAWMCWHLDTFVSVGARDIFHIDYDNISWSLTSKWYEIGELQKENYSTRIFFVCIRYWGWHQFLAIGGEAASLPVNSANMETWSNRINGMLYVRWVSFRDSAIDTARHTALQPLYLVRQRMPSTMRTNRKTGTWAAKKLNCLSLIAYQMCRLHEKSSMKKTKAILI